MVEQKAQSRKTAKLGTVVSTGGEKTVVVKVVTLVMDPLYQRFVRRSNRFMAHDEDNACQQGDQVQIVECRPLSRHKRWRVSRIVQRAT